MSGTVIHVGAEAPKFAAFADFLDGQSAIVHRVELSIDETAPALVIHPVGKNPIHWPLDRIRSLPDQADRSALVMALADRPLARLIVNDADVVTTLRGRCKNIRLRPPVRGTGRIFLWAGAAVASVALIIGILIPLLADQLAGLLPPEGEKALGDTTFEQIREAFGRTGLDGVAICDNSEGREALAKMEARLSDDLNLPYPLTVHVLDHELVNAFALPGGYVVFFDGLIQAADHPDEVAAVFAHEIGHVAARDPARIALRTAGSVGVLGLLFGDFSGGAVVLFLAERLVQADYTQAAEAAADAFAHDRLRKAGLPPSALAGLFRTLKDRYGDSDSIVAHFVSHPALGDRIAAAETATEGMPDRLTPSLSEDEWRALRDICSW